MADIALAGRWFAPHYAEAEVRTTARDVSLSAAPNGRTETVAEPATGDRFAVLEVSGGWAWGYAVDGPLVGYLPADSLRA